MGTVLSPLRYKYRYLKKFGENLAKLVLISWSSQTGTYFYELAIRNRDLFYPQHNLVACENHASGIGRDFLSMQSDFLA